MKELEINLIEKQIFTIVTNVLCLDERSVSDTAHIREELGADSLDIAELIMTLAKTFDIEVRDGDAHTISTIHDIVIYIETRMRLKQIIA